MTAGIRGRRVAPDGIHRARTSDAGHRTLLRHGRATPVPRGVAPDGAARLDVGGARGLHDARTRHVLARRALADAAGAGEVWTAPRGLTGGGLPPAGSGRG